MMIVQSLARWDGHHFYRMGTFDSSVLALALVHGQLVAGGGFSSVDSQPRAGLARFHSGKWADVGGGVGGTVLALAAAGDCLWVGGDLHSAGGAAVIAGVRVANAANWCFDAAGSGAARWDAVAWADAAPAPSVSAIALFAH